MTKHLLDQGHLRIAFFAGPAASPAAQERLEGYRHALRDAGVDMTTDEPLEIWRRSLRAEATAGEP